MTPAADAVRDVRPPLLRRPVGWRSWLGLLVAVGIAAGYLWVILSYWSPAHAGVDQNAYLVSARSVLAHGTTAYTPAEPYGFVGAMYVHAGDGTYYPKYPAGLSVIYALAMVASSLVAGDELLGAHLVSPVAAALALLGTFVIARRLAGDFAAWLAMLLLGGGQLYLLLSVNPNSHAAGTAAAVWGFALLIRWLTDEGDGRWQPLLAGALLGLTVTIRYSEGLLVIPLTLACVGVLRTVGWRRAILPLVGWGVPVALLAGYNLLTLGKLTGYDQAGESTGFGLDFFLGNWERAIRQVHDDGLPFVLAVGLLGLVVMTFRKVGVGGVLLLWVVPQFLLYMAYYFAPEFPLAYSRFFVSLFPPIVIGAVWLLAVGVLENRAAGPRAAGAVAAGAVVALACVVGTSRAAWGNEASLFGTTTLEAAAVQNANLAALGDAVRRVADEGDVVVAPRGGVVSVAHHLQFVGDYEFYGTDAFTRNAGGWTRRGGGSAERPDPIDPERIRQLKAIYTDDVDLDAEAARIFDAALAEGRQVLVVGPEQTVDRFVRRRAAGFEAEVLTRHVDTPRTFAEPLDDSDRSRFFGRARGKPSRALQRATTQSYVLKRLTRAPADEPVEAELGLPPGPTR